MAEHRNSGAPSGRENLVLIGILAGAALLLIAGLAALSMGGNGGAKSGPRLTVDREQIDFGRVPLDKSVKAEFRITNTGDTPLTLDASAPVQVLKGC